MQQEELVKIEGSNGYKGKRYPKDSDSIVFLTDGWYHKNDYNKVVRVNGRYYRKDSPLVVQLNRRYYGEEYFALKEDSWMSSKNGWFLKGNPPIEVNEVDAEGELTLTSLDPIEDAFQLGAKYRCIGKDGKSCLLRDGENFHKWFVRMSSSGTFVHRSNPSYKIVSYQKILFNIEERADWSAKLLIVEKILNPRRRDIFDTSETEYAVKESEYNGVEYKGKILGENSFVRDSNDNIICSLDELARMDSNSRKALIDTLFESVTGIHVDENYRRVLALVYTILSGEDLENVKSLFSVKNIESSSGKTEVLYEKAANIIYSIGYTRRSVVILDKNSDNPKFFYSRLLKSNINIDFDEAVEKMKPILSRKVNDYVSNLDEYYKPNRLPLMLDNSVGSRGGNYLFHESSKRGLVVSPTKRNTGGIGYTFGVELETSFGLLPMSLIEENGLKAVGDRSVGALEYVTKPLHGDNGMSKLKDICDDLSNFCLVDNRCGIHIHVGGSEKTDSPSFNRRFSVYAIKLGYAVQDQMFSLVHPKRTENVNGDGISYCGKIDKEYSKISMSNWREKLGKYIFGEPYSGERNSSSRLFRWTNARYRWLNLINCNTDNSGRSDAGTNSGFKTVEFRLWDGSLNYEDIKNFVRISLAFTKFVDCHQKEIDEHANSITIEYIVTRTMNKTIAAEVIEWMEKRRKK